jgi:mannose-6-phosphate isomerase-like protein (cupin superfamily)
VFIANESNFQYRFGDSGPKYLMRGPRIDFGLVRLLPGQDFPNHLHKRIEENFFILEGEVSVVVRNQTVQRLGPGDLLRVDPHESHCLVNTGSAPMVAVFVKAPFDPKDKVDVDLKDEFLNLGDRK